MTLDLILLWVIPGVEVQLIWGGTMMIKLRWTGLMDRFVGEVRLCWRRPCRFWRAMRWSRIITVCRMGFI